MPEKKVRFAVGSPHGPRSAIWSLVGQKHDAYIIPLEVKSTAKISLHLRTGEFSWGYTSEYFKNNREEIVDRSKEYGITVNPTSRDFERWRRPSEFGGGTTLPIRIYVANEALQTNAELPTDQPIRWVVPREGRAVGFVFLLVDAAIPSEQVAGHPDLELIERVEFPHHRQSIVLVAHHIDAQIVTAAAMRSAIEFAKLFPDFQFPETFRFYAQTTPEPETGSRNLIEVPTLAMTTAKAS